MSSRYQPIWIDYTAIDASHLNPVLPQPELSSMSERRIHSLHQLRTSLEALDSPSLASHHLRTDGSIVTTKKKIDTSERRFNIRRFVNACNKPLHEDFLQSCQDRPNTSFEIPPDSIIHQFPLHIRAPRRQTRVKDVEFSRNSRTLMATYEII